MLGELAGGVEQLEKRVEELQHSSRQVEQAVTQVLVDLQFQDRVSQVMAHVRDNMEQLPALLRENRDI